MSTAGPALYLGLDSSTQGLKATAIDKDFRVVHTDAINFARDLPRYGLQNGVHVKAGNVVTQPTLMVRGVVVGGERWGCARAKPRDLLTPPNPPPQFVEALDLLFSRMAAKGFPFASVAAVSGSGQQHGSAYWRTGARSTLKGAAPGKPLVEQLAGAFRVADSPIWMDSSTTAQCAALEKAIGGAAAVAELSGSRAYERFTGNQIAKIAASDPAAYQDTERISLVRRHQ